MLPDPLKTALSAVPRMRAASQMPRGLLALLALATLRGVSGQTALYFNLTGIASTTATSSFYGVNSGATPTSALFCVAE